MRTEYRFFGETSGFISNIFYFNPEWEQPNNFILSDILFWLADNRKRRGEIGLEGFFSVTHIADVLQRRGFVNDDVVAACSWLLRNYLIEADHMNQSKIALSDSIKLTAAGFIHLRILCERMEYLYGVMTVTPISEQMTAERIAEYIRRENQIGYLNIYQMARCVEEFLRYLQSQYRRLSEAYPEFGAERTGAAFVIKQIESVIDHFKNPSASSNRRQNILDEGGDGL